MASPVVNPNLTNIDNAEVASSWNGFNDGSGGSPTPQDDTDIFIQGNQAVSVKVSGTSQNKGAWFDNGSGIDMTVTGRHLYIWCACTTVSILNSITAGGLYIKVASDASGNNWNKYFVGGFGTTPDGRFIRYVIDLNKTPSETAATPATLSSIRWFGMGVKLTGSAKSENLAIDRMDYGTGLQIEQGDSGIPASWEALFQVDDNTSFKYGIIEKRSGTYFLKGGVEIGDAAGTDLTLWSDQSGAQIVFENPLYWNGAALVSAIDGPNLYKIILQGNGTGNTDIDFGQVVGTGDDRQGILGGSISSDGPKFSVDAETDIAQLTSVNFFGVTFTGAGNIKMSSSTKTDCIGCIFVNCDEIQPNDAEFLNDTLIAPIPDRGLEFLSTHNIKQVVFVAGDTADTGATAVWANDISGPTWNDWVGNFNDSSGGAFFNPFPATEAVGDYCAFGFSGKFQKLRINTLNARVGGTLVWEYWNGSTWSSLTTTDGTNTLSTTGLQDVTFTPPTDWAALSLNDEDPVFYVRLRVTVVMTTNPDIDYGFIADRVEHHLHIPTANTYSAVDLVFFGFSPAGLPKWMGENSGASASVIINAQGDTNISDAETDETGGGTTTVNNTVTVKVTTRDATTLAIVTGVSVLLEADTGGDLPAGDVVTITRVATTATVAHTAHGMPDGSKVAIRGADQSQYNGVKTITVTGPNAYTYTVSGAPDTPATGTITATAVILSGVTDGSGILQDTGFDYTNPQPTIGKARKSTATPFYATAPITGTIAAQVGLTTTAFMVGDE